MTKNKFLSNSIDIADATDNTKFIFRSLKENPVVVCKPSEGLSLKPNELLELHELIYFLTWRDLKVRYKQTALGVIRTVLQLLLTKIVLTIFFGSALTQSFFDVSRK